MLPAKAKVKIGSLTPPSIQHIPHGKLGQELRER